MDFFLSRKRESKLFFAILQIRNPESLACVIKAVDAAKRQCFKATAITKNIKPCKLKEINYTVFRKSSPFIRDADFEVNKVIVFHCGKHSPKFP